MFLPLPSHMFIETGPWIPQSAHPQLLCCLSQHLFYNLTTGTHCVIALLRAAPAPPLSHTHSRRSQQNQLLHICMFTHTAHISRVYRSDVFATVWDSVGGWTRCWGGYQVLVPLSSGISVWLVQLQSVLPDALRSVQGEKIICHRCVIVNLHQPWLRAINTPPSCSAPEALVLYSHMTQGHEPAGSNKDIYVWIQCIQCMSERCFSVTHLTPCDWITGWHL